MMSRSLRAETRSRGKEDSKRPMQSLDKVRRWEKKWMTIHDTTMKIYKWVPIADERKKKSSSSANKENRLSSRDNSMSAFQMGGDDSNTAMSLMSDSQDGTQTDFSCAQFNISEDSNSEPPFKKKLAEG